MRSSFSIQQIASAPKETSYTVRMHFAELDDVPPGSREFDVLLQGKMVLAGLDVARATGGTRRALIKEFRGVTAAGALNLQLVQKKGAALDSAPFLNALEVIRE